MYGFRGIALELMKSYFNNRYQYTKISKSKSTTCIYIFSLGYATMQAVTFASVVY